MRKEIEKVIEELALLAVMLHEGDELGFEMVLESCKSLQDLIKEVAEDQKLADALAAIIEFSRTAERKNLLTALQSFSSAAQNYLRDPAATVFPCLAQESSPLNKGWGADLAQDYDAELIAEFIIKHTSLLDEYEAELLQAAASSPASKAKGEDLSELDRYIKGYLHNVKGEAGTVGLIGIAEVTHQLEDLVVEEGALKLIEQLLAYKEWLLSCLNAWSSGGIPATPAAQFLQLIAQQIEGHCTNSIATSEEPPPVRKSLGREPETSTENDDLYFLTGELDVLGEFIVEAEDHLNDVEEALLDRRGTCNLDDIGAFFRAIHSVKGGSAYFGLREMTESSHLTETLLDEVRNERVSFDENMAGLLLSYLDLQKDLFAAARQGLSSGGSIQRTHKTGAYLAELKQKYGSIFSKNEKGHKTAKKHEEKAVSTAATAQSNKPQAGLGGIEKALQDSSSLPTESSATGRNEKHDVKTFLKVEATRLDQLIDYVGELVISSSMLTQSCRTFLGDNEAVMKNSHQLEQITRELQYIAMSMRLIPVKGVFQKMARLVWDLGRKMGKNIVFKMEGEDTELDRTVIDKIADPLMHMVRNSLDHGIETPEERENSGKPCEGTILLRAFHKAGTVHIQIVDDGRGLDHEKLRKKAVEKGLIGEEQVLSRQELWQMIFAPGFSTAAVVTDVSGRGVGMDVVRRNIESMRGRVLIDSEIGVGTTITIELPLTLAIMDGIETALGHERFIIPTLSIVEFLKPTKLMLSHTFDKGETLEFRGKYLPIFRLSKIFDVKPKHDNPSEAILVIVESAGEAVAIMVDDVVGKHSTVIKSLGSMFKGIRGLAGCTIMPDGYVGLILDVQGLVALARSSNLECSSRLPATEERLSTFH